MSSIQVILRVPQSQAECVATSIGDQQPTVRGPILDSPDELGHALRVPAEPDVSGTARCS
jgi:hypothetical protein